MHFNLHLLDGLGARPPQRRGYGFLDKKPRSGIMKVEGEKEKMTFPTLHLNGTSAEDLLEGFERAHQAVRKAMEVVAKSAPNQRDFYLQGPEAWHAALGEHEDRMQRLNDVELELGALAEHVSVEDAHRRSRKGGN